MGGNSSMSGNPSAGGPSSMGGSGMGLMGPMGPLGDRTHEFLALAYSMIALSTISVFLRFLSRRVTRMSLMWDDWLILVGLVSYDSRPLHKAGWRSNGCRCTQAFAITTAALPINSVYEDHAARQSSAPPTMDEMHRFLKKLYVYEITYAVGVAAPRLSVIALYYRVFCEHNLARWFTTAVYMFAIGDVVWMLCSVCLVPCFRP